MEEKIIFKEPPGEGTRLGFRLPPEDRLKGGEKTPQPEAVNLTSLEVSV